MSAELDTDVAGGELSPDHLARLLATAQRLAKLGSWSWVPGQLAAWSDEMYRILEMPPGTTPIRLDELIRLIRDDHRDGVVDIINCNINTGRGFETEFPMLLPGGAERWMKVIGALVDGVRWEGICQDITDRKRAEAVNHQIESDLRNQERVLGWIARGDPLDATLNALCLMFEERSPNSHCSILTVDDVEGVLRHAAGPSLPVAYLRAIDGLPVGHGRGACGTAAAINEVVIVEDIFADPLTEGFVELCREHNLRSAWSTPLNDTSGTVIGTFAVYHPSVRRPTLDEIQSLQAAGSLAALAIERHRTERALTDAAQKDPLTQLPNRSQFETFIRRMNVPGKRVGVLFLDLDRFKWINDSLGHQAGDRVLIEVAARLRAVVCDGEVLARFGGDEFTLLVTDATPERMDAAADRVDAALLEPFVIDGGEFFLSASIGIATNDHDTDASGLVRDADAAMYVAKERGRARRATYDAGLRERAIARVTLESELRRAIERDEFELYYQPLVDLTTGEWTMVEALVRWQHPTRGLLGPDEFIPLAEETGFILPLGSVILERAVGQAAELCAGGLPIAMGVNLSVVQLTDPSIALLIEGLVAVHGLSPDLLVLEVTETAVMEQFELAHATLGRLAAIGVQIVIDDFGTGYSSIARLGDLPVIGVKIDRHFATLLNDRVDADQVFAAITSLAHAFGLQVIAEGIETQQMLDRATAIGCDVGQGFHLGRPVPADQLVPLLRKRAPRPTPQRDLRMLRSL